MKIAQKINLNFPTKRDTEISGRNSEERGTWEFNIENTQGKRNKEETASNKHIKVCANGR